MTAAARLPDANDDRLVRSALTLLISNATGAVLGIVFWAVAAHLFPAADVGYGVAEIAAMTALASVAELNLGAIYPRFLYAAGARAGYALGAGYAASIGLAIIVGAAFLAVAPHHTYIASGALPSVLFVVGVVLWVIFTTEDSALVGLRATFWVPVENTAFSVAKIILLPVFAAVAVRSGVFYSWTLPVVACIVPVNYYLFRRLVPAHASMLEGRSSFPTRRVVGTILLGEYLGGLAQVALTTVPALLIAVRLGPIPTAYFQTPWVAGTSFDLVLWTIAVSLISESSARPLAAQGAVRKAVRLTVVLMTPTLVAIAIGAHVFLRVIGHSYSDNGTTLLRTLVLAVPFMGVNVLYVTFARMARRVRRVFAVQVTISAVILVLTDVLIGPMGITGAGVAFLTGQAAMAIVLLPSVVRQYRRPGMTPGFAAGTALVVQSAENPEPMGEGAPGAAVPRVDPPDVRRRSPSWRLRPPPPAAPPTPSGDSGDGNMGQG